MAQEWAPSEFRSNIWRGSSTVFWPADAHPCAYDVTALHKLVHETARPPPIGLKDENEQTLKVLLVEQLLRLGVLSAIARLLNYELRECRLRVSSGRTRIGPGRLFFRKPDCVPQCQTRDSANDTSTSEETLANHEFSPHTHQLRSQRSKHQAPPPVARLPLVSPSGRYFWSLSLFSVGRCFLRTNFPRPLVSSHFFSSQLATLSTSICNTNLTTPKIVSTAQRWPTQTQD